MDELANFSSYDFKKTGYDNYKDLEDCNATRKFERWGFRC